MLLSCTGNRAPATGATAGAAFVLPRMFRLSNVRFAGVRSPPFAPDDRAERRGAGGGPGYWLRVATALRTE